eukprot:1446331-Rhodomonas_salina.2
MHMQKACQSKKHDLKATPPRYWSEHREYLRAVFIDHLQRGDRLLMPWFAPPPRNQNQMRPIVLSVHFVPAVRYKFPPLPPYAYAMPSTETA